MAYKTYHKGKYYVTFKRGFEDLKKDITVSIDKVFESESLKVCLSDDDDPTFLCVLHVSRCDYEDLKQQQGLLIDFDNFPAQLVRLLQQCATSNMFLIMQQTNPVQYYLEIVEHNEFKKLVHLSLKTGPATDTEIKQHMADTIINLKKTLATLKISSSSSEALWNDKCVNMERKIHDLAHLVSKMEEDKSRRETEFQEALKQEKDKLSQETMQYQKSVELNMKSQMATYQDNLSRKDKQIDDLSSRCNQLKESICHLENQISEKCQRLDVLEKEVQKSHIEVATLTAKNASLEREVMEKDKFYKQLNSQCSHLEKTAKENSEMVKDLNRSLQVAKAEKASLEERLSLSESLVNKNNEAVRLTSEQLLKANQIISKQNSDLIEMKEKMLCRTAIVLEQEKVIESNSKEIEQLKSEIQNTAQTVKKLEVELESLKEKYEASENALKARDETIKNNNMVIQWLHKKMENRCDPYDQLPGTNKSSIQTRTSSTPYFISKHNNSNSTQAASDESINFYATSKLSNIEESPVKAGESNNNVMGLNPVYLKPAVDDNQVKSVKSMSQKSTESTNQNGKENKNINLPKVNYREKKSSRSSTHRTTPVSAYFPR